MAIILWNYSNLLEKKYLKMKVIPDIFNETETVSLESNNENIDRDNKSSCC